MRRDELIERGGGEQNAEEGRGVVAKGTAGRPSRHARWEGDVGEGGKGGEEYARVGNGLAPGGWRAWTKLVWCGAGDDGTADVEAGSIWGLRVVWRGVT